MRGTFNDNLGQVQSVLIWSLIYIVLCGDMGLTLTTLKNFKNNLKYEKKNTVKNHSNN